MYKNEREYARQAVYLPRMHPQVIKIGAQPTLHHKHQQDNTYQAARQDEGIDNMSFLRRKVWHNGIVYYTNISFFAKGMNPWGSHPPRFVNK